MTVPGDSDCATRACGLDRRALLVAAGLATTATLTACTAENPGANAGPDAAAKEAAAKEQQAQVAPGKEAAKDVPRGIPPKAPETALAIVAHVPVGGGVLVEKQTVLVVQPTAGVFKAFDARCTHQGVAVKAPDAEGNIVCPRHKATFKAADGSVVRGPAERALPGIPVKVDGPYVVRV